MKGNGTFLVLALVLFPPAMSSAQTILSSSQASCPDANRPEEEAGFKVIEVPEPRIERKGELRIAGVNASILAHKEKFFERIPQAWALLSQQLPQVENKTNTLSPFSATAEQGGYATYEICFGGRSNRSFNFMPGVQVSDLESLRPGFTGIRLPPRNYAVFTFDGLREDIGNFRYSLTKVYWKKSKYRRIAAPNIAVYPPSDDPSSEKVKMELWVAVAP